MLSKIRINGQSNKNCLRDICTTFTLCTVELMLGDRWSLRCCGHWPGQWILHLAHCLVSRLGHINFSVNFSRLLSVKTHESQTSQHTHIWWFYSILVFSHYQLHADQHHLYNLNMEMTFISDKLGWSFLVIKEIFWFWAPLEKWVVKWPWLDQRAI